MEEHTVCHDFKPTRFNYSDFSSVIWYWLLYGWYLLMLQSKRRWAWSRKSFIFMFLLPGWVFSHFSSLSLGAFLYLFQRAERWDILAKSSAQIGFIFISITLISGMLWAKPVWGAYWVWEPRLTISLVQWLVYFSYSLLRRSLGTTIGANRITSVYGIVAFITVPLSWFAIRWWRTIHPEIISSSGSLPIKMLTTMLFSLLTFTVIYFTFLFQLMNIERLEREKAELLGMEDEREE